MAPVIVFGVVNTVLMPSIVPERVSLYIVLPPDIATFAVPPPPFVTVAPEVKSIVVTFTTGVIPSVTISGLPEPPPLPAPVISISLLPRHGRGSFCELSPSRFDFRSVLFEFFFILGMYCGTLTEFLLLRIERFLLLSEGIVHRSVIHAM